MRNTLGSKAPFGGSFRPRSGYTGRRGEALSRCSRCRRGRSGRRRPLRRCDDVSRRVEATQHVQCSRRSNATSVQPATKAASKAVQKDKASSPAVTSSERSQSVKDVESYWTKEQMDDAQPMEKTRPGGSPSSSPAPSGSTAPGSAPTTSSSPQRVRTKSPKSAASTGVVTAPAATPNPGYWDDEAMSGAQPLEKTRPGRSGSASSEPSGTTAPGSPPS